MENATSLRLIKVVDPNKVKITINEKFSKLTLSSNKKQYHEEETKNANQSNASRNLLSDFEDNINKNSKHCNAILKSSSSSFFCDTGDIKTNAEIDIAPECKNETTECMEHLQISEDVNSLNDCPDGQSLSRIASIEVINVLSTSDEESVIFVSDTSSDNCTDQAIENEFHFWSMSEIKPSTETLQTSVRSTTCDERLDRMEAFLHDVSEERRKMEANSLTNSSIFSHLHFNNEKEITQNEKSRLIAMADTESMKTSVDLTNSQRQHAIALDDTEAMTETIQISLVSPSPENSVEESIVKNQEIAARRLANDDTQDNTSLGSINDTIEEINSSDLQLNKDSVLISETSSEHNITNEFESPNTTIEQNIVASKEILDDSKHSENELSLQYGINISAKINITLKIQTNYSISHESSNNDSNNDSTYTENSKNGNNSNNCTSNHHASISGENENFIGRKDKAPDNDNENTNEFSTEIKEKICPKKKKLLTELYGDSWRTPEVIRTLNRISFNDSVVETVKCLPFENVDDDKNHSLRRNNIGSRLQTVGTIPSKKIFQKDFRTSKTEKKNTNFTPLKDRITNKHLRKLIDNNSDEENIPNDSCMDKTYLSDESDKFQNVSNNSFNALTEESEENKVDGPVKKNKTKNKIQIKKKKKDQLIYLDLSHREVSILKATPCQSPPANDDEAFERRLSQLLDSCQYVSKPTLEATPKSDGNTRRRLFTPNFGYEDDCKDSVDILEEAVKNIDINQEKECLQGFTIPPSFNVFNKPLESVKAGNPVFKTPTLKKQQKTPVSKKKDKTPSISFQLNERGCNSTYKYSFLKSLDVCVGKSLCHPDALVFRENYRERKEDLSNILYELYNRKIFNNELDVSIVWNKKLLNTAGRCLNKKKLNQRLSVVELSDKVLTSADRLRCTLIHELCHAATWILNGEGGHGATWKKWAGKANAVFPDLPKIGICHQYDIEYKYTYKCTLCEAKSYYHSKSKKVENIRCSYCYGAIEIFLNKKDKEGNIKPTPVREPTGFAKFVKEKYRLYKRPGMKHAEIMKLLSNEYAGLK